MKRLGNRLNICVLLLVCCTSEDVTSIYVRLQLLSKDIVGMAGFEPTTSSTPCWRDTGLRYIPHILSSEYSEFYLPPHFA